MLTKKRQLTNYWHQSYKTRLSHILRKAHRMGLYKALVVSVYS